MTTNKTSEAQDMSPLDIYIEKYGHLPPGIELATKQEFESATNAPTVRNDRP